MSRCYIFHLKFRKILKPLIFVNFLEGQFPFKLPPLKHMSEFAAVIENVQYSPYVDTVTMQKCMNFAGLKKILHYSGSLN